MWVEEYDAGGYRRAQRIPRLMRQPSSMLVVSEVGSGSSLLLLKAKAKTARLVLCRAWASQAESSAYSIIRNCLTKQAADEAKQAGGLPLGLPIYAIWGANTNVGKTLGSVGIAHAAKALKIPLTYVKPVQTGYPQDSDARLVALATQAILQHGPHAGQLLSNRSTTSQPTTSITIPHTHTSNGTTTAAAAAAHGSGHAGSSLTQVSKVLFAWGLPVSPHLAVALQGRDVDDASITSALSAELHADVARMRAASAADAAGSSSSTTCGDGVAAGSDGLILVETAGGVTSPGPSGTLACDLLRPLRLPCVLVGDARLGGIAATLSAYESLLLRGHDVHAVLLLDPGISMHDAHMPGTPPAAASPASAAGPAAVSTAGSSLQLDNASFIRHYLQHSLAAGRLGLQPPKVFAVPACPPPPQDWDVDRQGLDPALQSWLHASVPHFAPLVQHMFTSHAARVQRLASMRDEASRTLWWPFTQHHGMTHGSVTVVDHRCGEHWHVAASDPSHQDPSKAHQYTSAGVNPGDVKDSAFSSGILMPGQALRAVLQPLYDAAGSWWTQACTAAHQPDMALSMAYAAGRYSHVMFPQTAHEPALALTQRLLSGPGRGWASRAFYSDNGSTAIEVALKMAFRKYLADRGMLEAHSDANSTSSSLPPLHVLGLHGAYHGDTLGAQDCVAPSVYNARLQAPWYSGRGVYLQPPYVALVQGKWAVHDAPEWLRQRISALDSMQWPSLDAAIQHARMQANSTYAGTSTSIPGGEDATAGMLYNVYRSHILHALEAHERDSGALVGAGILEPLLQGAGGMLLMDPLFVTAFVQVCRSKHIPVIFDEVFTGLYRIGAESAAQLLQLQPDIACYGKLLTGGSVPMAVTLASEDVFKAFEGPSKLFALLHGHSYTAFPLGCTAACTALDLLSSPTHNPSLCTPQRASCSCTRPCGQLLPMWPPEVIQQLSCHPLVSRVTCIGTVLAAELKPLPDSSSSSNNNQESSSGSGYGSNAAAGIVALLKERHNIFARPLGNVVYVMVPPTAQRSTAAWLAGSLSSALAAWLQGGRAVGNEAGGAVV